MDNSSVSNCSVDQHQSTSLASECKRLGDDDRDTLGLLAIEVVESETRIQQQIQSEAEQHIKLDLWAKKSEEDEEMKGRNAAEAETIKLQQQQLLKANFNSCLPLVKEEQLACAIRMDSSNAALIDKHLATIYPVYLACARAILIRQARDLLVCSYFGCLQSFEMQFLCKFAQIAAELRQRHAIGESVLWNKGWPLTTPTGEVILHLGALENAFVGPGDIYLCVKSVNKTEAPQLYVSWRNPSNAIPTQQNLPHASVTTHLITSEPTKAKLIKFKTFVLI
ncbi:uncharacterized protein [Eurosta solidaginis]|uniref:uncharacterized protein isoform X1 n=1 Tax=Eurosta solidaginis TaxID=178769 RepID=UPI0035308730